MIHVPLDILRAIEQGVDPKFKAIIYWQQPEGYTADDYLIGGGDISTSMSEGSYEIANTSITLKNDGFYFSRRFAKELPNNKLVEIYLVIASLAILVFRGTVAKDWKLTKTMLTLNITA